jgi:hypothetical protein
MLISADNISYFDSDDDECTCDLYGYCVVCSREPMRPEHVFNKDAQEEICLY